MYSELQSSLTALLIIFAMACYKPFRLRIQKHQQNTPLGAFFAFEKPILHFHNFSTIFGDYIIVQQHAV
jgi:hypothetical protein